MDDLTPDQLIDTWQAVPHTDKRGGVRSDLFAHRPGVAQWYATMYEVRSSLPLGVDFEEIQPYLN